MPRCTHGRDGAAHAATAAVLRGADASAPELFAACGTTLMRRLLGGDATDVRC